MALRDIKTGEMIDIFRDWQAGDSLGILQGTPLTAPFVGPIDHVHGLLAGAVARRPEPLPAEERQRLAAVLEALDAEFDHGARVLDHALSTLAMAVPEKRLAYERARAVLFPDGLAVINTGYRSEAGETERIAERVASEPDVKALLDSSALNGAPLSGWYDALVDVGRHIGPIATRYELKQSRAEEVVLEFRARQKWVQLVTTLRRNAELAGWDAQNMAAIFGAVDRLAAQRTRRPAPAPDADAPAPPTPRAPDPTPPDVP